MTGKALLSQVQHLTFIFQENYMNSANLIFAIFLTITIGFGALAACFFPECGEPAGGTPAPVGRQLRGRRTLRRLARAK